MATATRPDLILFLSDSRGIYVPRDFAEGIADGALSGVKEEDIAILRSGPDHERYWEAWESVLENAVVTDRATGTVYHVYQDGDCWLVPEGMEWSNEEGGFIWPDTDEV